MRLGVPAELMLEQRIAGTDEVPAGGDVDAADPVRVKVEVGVDGAVTAAAEEPRPGAVRSDAAAALAAVRAWRFRPFTFDGQPVVAVGSVEVHYRSPGRWGETPVSFPEIDRGNLHITLERTACFGACPDYRVEIGGDGLVLFSTRGGPATPAGAVHRAYNGTGVLLPGTHRTRIGKAELDALVERFREARFFALADEYQAPITDFPSYVLSFRSGAAAKRVVDYAGELAGMPREVRALEDAVDAAAGTARWVKGTASTVEALAAEGFDFRSRAAGELLFASFATAEDPMIVDLIERGVPLDRPVRGLGMRRDEPLGEAAVRRAIETGRVPVFEALRRKGWLSRTPAAVLSTAFAEAAGGCDPGMARALVAAGADPSARGSGGETALMNALQGPGPCYGRDTSHVVAVVQELIRLGVPVDAADEEGKTALFKVPRVEFARLLLASGARAGVYDREGRSPALSSWDDAVVLTLLRAGADPAGKNFEGKTLAEVARERTMPATLAWLEALTRSPR
jgi:hypothetical protein